MNLTAALDALDSWGEPAFRKAQVRQAVTRDLAASWEDVTTISKALRARLNDEVPFAELELREEARATDGTVKGVFTTADGFPLEAVLMRHKDRRTVCLSSQSGCALACTFCATGTMGLGRNLTTGEIFEQLLWASRIARSEDARVGNVVMMGMGEPFMNYDNVLDFCKLANDHDGYNLGARSMAISTAGWVPGINRLAREPIQVKLALSLHAPNDALRTELMPVTKRYPIERLMQACREYREETRRRIFIEYLLLDGVNDRPEHANELANLLYATAPGGFHVNLIVYNPTGSAYRASGEGAIVSFQRALEKRKIDNSLRRSRGQDIEAACGQLAIKGVRERRDQLRAERAL